jgi:hypothetical protein
MDENKMNEDLDIMSIVQEFKEFANESHNYFADEIKRIKEDREFAGGGQSMWNDNDTTNRGNHRSQVSMNFIDNYVSAIVNPFKVSPYSITISPKDQNKLSFARIIQKEIKSIESSSNINGAYYNALKDDVVTGYGYAYVTTEQNRFTKDIEIKVYPVLDSTMVIPDFSSKELDGSDSEQMAIVEYMKIRTAKSKFGDDVVGDMKYRAPLVAGFGETWRTPEGCLALVTYFRIKRTKTEDATDEVVEYFKMIGDKIIEHGELNCPFIPIVPFKGNEIFRKGKKISVGIVDKGKGPSKNINYMASLLRERISKAPKPLFFAGKSAIEGNEEYYENIDKSFNPLLVYNDRDADGNPIPAPQRVENAVQTNDLSSEIAANLNYLSLIIGMPSQGITNSLGQNETAESVLMRTRSSESNQSHFYENAKMSIRHIGRIILYFIKAKNPELNDINVNDYEVIINDGPELITTRIEQRKDLIALSQILPENMKPLVAQKIAATMDNDEAEILSKELYMMLPPELKVNTQEDPAAKQILDQMSAQIDEYVAKSQQDDKDKAQLQAALFEMENDSRSKMIVAEMNNRARLQELIIKENGLDNRLANQLLAEAEKKILDLQTEDSKAKLNIVINEPIFNKHRWV